MFIRIRNWKRLCFVLGFLIVIGQTVSLQAEEAEKIINKNLVIIEHDHIVLGDIFDHLDPDKRVIVISHAPLPGGQTTYHASYLAQLARKYDLDWTPQSPFDQTVIRRQARLVPHDILEKTVLERVVPYKKSSKEEGQYRITFSSNPNIYYSGEIPDHLSVQKIQYDSATDRFEVVVTTGIKSVITYRLSGRLIRTIQVPVLTRAVEEQDPIHEDGIEWIEMAADRVSHDVVTDKKATEGKVAKYKLKAEQVLRKDDLAPIIIKKGDVAKVIDEDETITFEAEALEEGVKNAVIRLINRENQQVIHGVIIDHQTVLITDNP